uniref:LOB domain-containing protein n=1 Tax=Aegilops tauschii subsp. strangulata TaxID=200361 RepID=A0A453FM60_AEGTS
MQEEPAPPRKRGGAVHGSAAREQQQQQQADETSSSAGPGAPCGACKFLRRRCVPGCVFAPHFSGSGRERGAAQFAAVHRVFGASNVAKLLSRVPVALRRDTARTVCYEAQARIADPVYGCVGTILALQHQVRFVPLKLALASTHPNSAEQLAVLQPAYSAASAPSQMVNYDDLPQAVDFMDVEPQMRGLES